MAGFSIAAILVLTILVAKEIEGGAAGSCNIYEGNWIYDPSLPVYNPADCPFLENREFDCQKNGRPDKNYLHYRWQPSACNLPRFDGKEFLERLRGKTLMFVGDSLSLNQWQSLTCMLHTAVPQAPYISNKIGGLSNFTFPDYKVSLLFSRNAYLVDIRSEQIGRVMYIDSVEDSRGLWEQMDMLIFDSWHWWIHTGKDQIWEFIREGNATYKDMNRLVAYEKAMKTWAKWANSVDPKKKNLIFQAVSPDHASKPKTCLGATTPLPGPSPKGSSHPAEAVLERVLRGAKEVYLLDITGLSKLRIDAHPSVYGFGGSKFPDCSHWCLPGVPDVWNQLLYTSLIPN
ncbi:protein trichome birefringence-like 43 [Heracleum sosnowskyi]|uniref:Protein trichome birefringence-like 43 n=1 Tax=Heracleum sosnowskyi TaxID=360622 RepID=A0AAD8JHY5_9APIA|nr:protein trichome birefringence-like 43 [Heracleum sosnowskyi]